ncbi:MAG TPA: hypothetical protein VGL59_02630 [Polyangia bacterium]|jgi:hypothetical protein
MPPPVQQKLHVRRQARIDHRQVAAKMRVQVIMKVITQMVVQVIVVVTLAVMVMIATAVALRLALGAVAATIAIVPAAPHPAVSFVST